MLNRRVQRSLVFNKPANMRLEKNFTQRLAPNLNDSGNCPRICWLFQVEEWVLSPFNGVVLCRSTRPGKTEHKNNIGDCSGLLMRNDGM